MIRQGCREVAAKSSSEASGHSQQTLAGLWRGIAAQSGAGLGVAMLTDDCVAGAGHTVEDSQL